MNLNRRIAIAATALALLAGPALAQGKITVAHTASGDYASGFWAADKGLFKKRGLDVEFKLVPLNPQIPAAIQSGSMQVGGPTTTVLLQAVDGGLDHVAIAGSGLTKRNFDSFGAMVRTDAAIAKAKDFEGKKVGAPGIGAFLHVLFSKWLIDNGVDIKKVTFVEVGFPQHLDVLKGGTVDAIVTGEPFTSRIAQAGVGKVVTHFTDNLTNDMPIIVYSATRAYAEANKDAMKKFAEAIAESTEAVNNPANADEVRAVIGRFIPMPAPVLATLRLGTWKAEVTEAGLKDWIDTMKSQGLTQNPLDMKKIIWK